MSNLPLTTRSPLATLTPHRNQKCGNQQGKTLELCGKTEASLDPYSPPRALQSKTSCTLASEPRESTPAFLMGSSAWSQSDKSHRDWEWLLYTLLQPRLQVTSTKLAASSAQKPRKRQD